MFFQNGRLNSASMILLSALIVLPFQNCAPIQFGSDAEDALVSVGPVDDAATLSVPSQVDAPDAAEMPSSSLPNTSSPSLPTAEEATMPGSAIQQPPTMPGKEPADYDHMGNDINYKCASGFDTGIDTKSDLSMAPDIEIENRALPTALVVDGARNVTIDGLHASQLNLKLSDTILMAQNIYVSKLNMMGRRVQRFNKVEAGVSSFINFKAFDRDVSATVLPCGDAAP